MSSLFRPGASIFTLLTPVAKAALGALRMFESWLDSRMDHQIVRELHSYDDHMLRDIGLTRADVSAALLASGVSATEILRRRSIEARTGGPALTRQAQALSETKDNEKRGQLTKALAA